MDGRRFRNWFISGCLVAGAVGCNRHAVRSPWEPPSGAQPVTGMPMSSAKKSFWGSSGPDQPIPVEAQEDVARKGPPRPETLVAFADCKLESAFNESTLPASRQQLLDEARETYQKALKADSKSKAAMHGMARYYTRLGDREQAIKWYKEYLTAHPDDKDVAHEVAIAHAQWKDWDGAVAWCDFTLKIDRENLSVRKTKAFCLARAGRFEEGFEVMCQVMPEAQARYLMARVLEHQNQMAASRQQLQMALRADPNYAEARAFMAELDQVIKGEAPDPNALRQAGFVQGQ
jgi:tetratricopeptide (TPR) repeat protein